MRYKRETSNKSQTDITENANIIPSYYNGKMRKEKIFAKIPQMSPGTGITFARFEAGNAAKPVEIPRRFCYNKTV